MHPTRSVAVLATLVTLLALATSCGSTTPHDQPPAASASAKPIAKDPLDERLPLDPAILTGKLESGLTYYVLPHKKPEKRAQMWLVVNAGSVLEDDDQRGLAHFCEHMAFNGTKRFPKQGLITFLEKAGVRFGADLNAYTNFDETVYTLQVPTDDPTVVDTSLAILRDWSDSVTYDPAEVEKERGVVLEEWRLGRGANMRIFDKQAPVVFMGSRYAERITIGKPETIKTASPDTLKRFYRDWYRPDLMAVVAVGDFDAKDVEAKIKKEFGDQKKPASPRPRTKVELPQGGEPRVSIETDPEMTATNVSFLSELPHRPEASVRDYRRGLAEQLYSQMLDGRLDELRRDPDAPFLAAGVSVRGLVRTEDAFGQSAAVKGDGVERGASALLEEVLRVERHGFTQTELDRAKTNMLRFFEEAATEREKASSGSLAREIVRNFLEDEAMPGIEAEVELAKRFLPTIGLEELDRMAGTFAAGSRVVTVAGPPTIVKPSPAAMLALTKDVAARDIAAYVDAVPTEPLMATPPAKGSIKSEKELPELGAVEWTLSNGARVVAKTTDFANDAISMTAFAPGGTSLSTDAGYDDARFAEDIIEVAGIGPYDAPQLRKAMAGKVVGVEPFIGELEQGLRGHATRADLETLMQLTNLAFTGVRKDPKAVEAWRTRGAEGVRNSKLSPDRAFSDEMMLFTYQSHPRRQPTTADTFAKIDPDKARAFYAERFANAGAFTFVFVGNLDLGALRSFSETYLASLPATKKKESWRDPKVTLPAGAVTKVVKRGTEPKASVRMLFHGAETWSRDTDNDMGMLGEALRHRLREVLREDMGGVYGVQVGGFVARRPRGEYFLTVSFGCAPENVEKLQQAVMDEIAAIQKDGIGADLVDKIKASRKRAHEVEVKENAFWLNELAEAYRFGDDPKVILDFDPWVAKITSDRIRTAARKYAKKSDLLVGLLQPER